MNREQEVKDLKNKKCKECRKGKYVELSINDDWDGHLTCDNCGDRVLRYQKGNK